MSGVPTPGTRSAVLRHLRHLDPPVGNRPRGTNIVKHTPNFVHVKDRFPYWNIVPGDIVRLKVGDVGPMYGLDPTVKTRGEGRVVSIDRTRNVAYLVNLDESNPKAPRNIRHIAPRLIDPAAGPAKGYTPNTAESPRAVHYSNLQLKLPDLKDTYAVRLVRKSLYYSRPKHRFVWKRLAIFRDETGVSQKIEVPWPKGRPDGYLPEYDAAKQETVQEETWLPWNKLDVLYAGADPLEDSPASVLRARMERLALNEKKLGEPSTQPKGGYAGFQPRGAVKAPFIPQPPSAAEVVSHTRAALAKWAGSPEFKEYLQEKQDCRSFAPEDYLAIAPFKGPAAGGSWTLPLEAAASTTQRSYERDEVTGQLVAIKQFGTSKTHLDSMPIEMLMKGDLMNPHSRARKTKERTRRIAARKEVNKALAKEDKERADLFKATINARLASQKSTSAKQAGGL